MAYEVACTILGHGNDSLERKPVPKGCCIVTAVLCGEASIVEINLKAINKLFKPVSYTHLTLPTNREV